MLQRPENQGPQHRVAFYPCCSTDIKEPLELLQGFADEVIFCDVNPLLRPQWNETVGGLPARLPKPVFLTEDARVALERIEKIDVLFYRCDSGGEGGSGVFVLGDSFLPELLARFSASGGYLISDGSNSRGSNFKRMMRASGLVKHGWHFRRADEQPFQHQGLHVITAVRAHSGA